MIACDVLICILFAINIAWLNRSISLEQYYVDKEFVHMTDFAVEVKNLPSKNLGAFDDLEQLKALLYRHISDVVANEP